MGFTKTPGEITPEILKFCHQISKNELPIYLKVESLPTSETNECFRNVTSYISKHGGSIQYGYRIFEWGEVMIEAEFHSIWVSPNGDFVDISPSDETLILFLPDNSKIYEGIPVDNIRQALIDDKIIHDFVEVCNQISEIRIKAGLSSNTAD